MLSGVGEWKRWAYRGRWGAGVLTVTVRVMGTEHLKPFRGSLCEVHKPGFVTYADAPYYSSLFLAPKGKITLEEGTVVINFCKK